MTLNNVVHNKTQIIKRCLSRISEEYADNPANLKNITKQDAIILNLQRACEASIDIAMHVVAERNVGLPQSSRHAFDLLLENGVIDDTVCKNMKAMIGFRNIAVHDYQSVNIDIVHNIIDHHLDDFRAFCDCVLSVHTTDLNGG